MIETDIKEPTQPRHLVFDLETNGLMPNVSVVHCIGIADVHTGELFSFPPDNIQAGLDMLSQADVLSGHNIISYDYKVLAKIYNWHPRPGTRTLDTMVIARVMHSDIKKEDFANPAFVKAGGKIGGHRLKDWGIRLGEHKAEYDGGWETYTPEMMIYMMQDVKTNVRLLQHLKPLDYPRAPLDLEHRVEEVCYRITEAGWPFDIKKAGQLHAMLCKRRDELSASLVARYGSWQEVDRVVVPKRPNVKLGYTGSYFPVLDVFTDEPVVDAKGKPVMRFEGQSVTHWKTVTFNPASRIHIEKKLREGGWEPTEFTDGGRAKLDDEVLESLKLPEATELVEFLMVQKRIGQIAEGAGAWLTAVGDDGRIHGRYNPMGTPHSRASHFGPNMAQVPNSHSLYGPECRELFTVPKGWKLVGADMAGCQLRVLGHYIGAFDGGKYGRIVSEGDIHTYHMEVAAPDIKSRDTSKTTIYALIFSAGPPKLGAINGGDAAMGRRIHSKLMRNIPGFGKLVEAVKAATHKGWLKGLDGRRVPIRSAHSALNYLIASGEAILCKTWACNAYDELCSKYDQGWDKDFCVVGFIHDEVNVACRAEIAEDVGKILVHHAEHAGDAYGFRTALKSESKIGITWQDVH